MIKSIILHAIYTLSGRRNERSLKEMIEIQKLRYEFATFLKVRLVKLIEKDYREIFKNRIRILQV